MFGPHSRPTWITVEPLTFSAISLLVSKTLHRSIDDCIPLSHFVFAASSGNAFSARNILTTLQRQHHVISPLFSFFRFAAQTKSTRLYLIGSIIIGCRCCIRNRQTNLFFIRYNMPAIEGSLANQKVSDPTDLTFLITHMRELPEEARKYLLWAAFFGET